MTVDCPKCGRATETGAIICPGCDYILDSSFLGDDITDDERDHRPGIAKGLKQPRVDFGEDAMILGNVDDEVSSFQVRDAGVSQREVTQARFYIGGAVAQLMEPDAIPEPGGGLGGSSIRMTPFERHVLSFINGRRSIGRIHKKSAMDEGEFKTAVAMLADKGFIRLKGWKKPRASSTGSALASHISQSVTGAREPERTIVASMDHIEAMAQAKRTSHPSADKSPAGGVGRPSRGPVPAVSSQTDTPVELRPEQATVIVPNPTISAPVVPSRRFASLQADVPDSAGEESANLDRPATTARVAAPDDVDGIHDPLAQVAAELWDNADNQSSVFADSGAAAAASPVEAEAPLRTAGSPAAFADDIDDADGFGDVHTSGALDAFKDPTGIGNSIHDDDADAGAAVDDGDGDDDGDDDDGDDGDDDGDDGDGDGDDDGGDDGDGAFVSAEEVDGLGPPRRIHDEVTAAPPRSTSMQRAPSMVEVELAADHDGNGDGDFDPPPPATAVMPAARPMTLPSEALTPLEPAPPPPTPPPVSTPPPALPGQGLPAAAPMMALPGQALMKPGEKATLPPGFGPGSPAVKAPPPVRVSATSQVSFDLRKKAERIYEQAMKDHAEGRMSSALMNAKLAMNFDPTVDAYKEFYEQLGREKGQPSGPRPQELMLFEQASDAEGKGDYIKAVALLEQAIAINPRAGALHNRIGVVLSIRLKRHSEALAHLKRAIELEPGSIVYMNNYSKVTGLLESMIEKDPNDKKRRGSGKDDDKVAIRKMRPKQF